jgi:hypothetical protein
LISPSHCNIPTIERLTSPDRSQRSNNSAEIRTIPQRRSELFLSECGAPALKSTTNKLLLTSTTMQQKQFTGPHQLVAFERQQRVYEQF